MLAVAVSVHPFQMLAVPVDCKYVVDRHGYFLPAFYELNDPYQEKKKKKGVLHGFGRIGEGFQRTDA